MKRIRKIRFPSLSAIEDIWLRRATTVAIEGARAIVTGGAFSPNVPVGRLSDIEWGWIVAAVIFGWIKTRAEQATNSGVDPDKYIRDTGIDPDPWAVGAIASILPELADSNIIDWNKSLTKLSRNEMEMFLSDALSLIQKAMVARDRGERMVTRQTPNAARTARETVAAAGGPLMTPDELNDPIDVI